MHRILSLDARCLDIRVCRLLQQSRPFGVELPPRHEVPHGDAFVACAPAVVQVEPVDAVDDARVQYNAQSGLCRVRSAHGRPRSRARCASVLAVLPDPVRFDGIDLAGNCGDSLRHVKMVAGVRSPCRGLRLGRASVYAPSRPGSRSADWPWRCLPTAPRGCGHLAPFGGDPVGGGWQAGGAPEFDHGLADGKAPSASHGSSA